MGKLFLLFLLLLFVPLTIEAQIARLSVTRGTSVSFIFDTLSEYENGISYPNWTKVGVYYDDQATGRTWKLEFKALSPFILGSDAHTLNLNKIRVSASNGGPSPAVNYYGNLFLTDSYSILVSGGPEGSVTDNIVNLSFDAGIINKVKNATPDYYSVDIIIMVLAE